MSKKPVEMGALLAGFADYISEGDLIAARLLSKISTMIVKKRLEMKMTQSEFAKYMDVSQGMVSKWESEDYNFSIEALANICSKLDLKIDIVLNSEASKYKALTRSKPSYGNHWKNSGIGMIDSNRMVC